MTSHTLLIPQNKGNEASSYLKYIIDNYETLSEYSIFVHGHQHSWHHEGKLSSLLNDVYDMKTFFHNINNYKLGFILTNPLIQEVLKWYDQYLLPYLGPSSQYGDWTYGHLGYAQFKVHKSLILSHPLSFYSSLYHWITTTDLSNKWTGRFTEWTWHLMWGQVPKVDVGSPCIKSAVDEI